MSKGKKIGVRVDPELWERFKKFVEDKHGTTRGPTKVELEKAIDAYLSGANPGEPIQRIEDDVATIQAQMARLEEAVADSDGGQTVPEPGSPPSRSTDDIHTYDDDSDGDDSDDTEPDVEEQFAELEAGHPSNDDADDTEADDEPPEPPHRRVSSVVDRARYIIEHGDVVSHVIEDAHSIKPRVIEDDVDDVWGYAKDETTRKVVDTVAEQLGAYPYLDPDYDDEWKLYFGDESDPDGAKTKPGKTGADAMAFIRRESKKSF